MKEWTPSDISALLIAITGFIGAARTTAGSIFKFAKWLLKIFGNKKLAERIQAEEKEVEDE